MYKINVHVKCKVDIILITITTSIFNYAFNLTGFNPCTGRRMVNVSRCLPAGFGPAPGRAPGSGSKILSYSLTFVSVFSFSHPH